MIKKLVLIGAGGFGREVAASLVRTINRYEPTYEFLGFLDDGSQFHMGSSIDGYPWLGNRYWILDHKDEIFCTCTIGDANLKKQIQFNENEIVKLKQNLNQKKIIQSKINQKLNIYKN